jgi:hypothetical protein
MERGMQTQIVRDSTHCSYGSKEFVVSLFGRDSFSFHSGERMASALVALLVFASFVALLGRALRRVGRKGDTEESDSNYWRIHGE